jgi:MoxR-like ATPase
VSHDPTQPSGPSLSKDDAAKLMEHVKWASERLRNAKSEIAKDVWNQDRMIEMILATLVAGGNVLAEGMPGLAKTLTVKAVARASGLDFKRIQFTPDLQPIDLTGSEVLNKTDNKTVNDHILIYAILRKIFKDEPEMLKIVADIKYDEDYKKAHELSEPYEDILKFFRNNK